MKCLVYVSRAQELFDEAALTRLATTAAVRNASLEVTGYLYYERDRFLQYLEAPAESLDRVMGSIERDSRHEILAVAEQGGARRSGGWQRRFSSWSVQWLPPSAVADIRLEHLVQDYLLFLKQVPGDARWRDGVWQAMDAVARFQRREARRGPNGLPDSCGSRRLR